MTQTTLIERMMYQIGQLFLLPCWCWSPPYLTAAPLPAALADDDADGLAGGIE